MKALQAAHPGLTSLDIGWGNILTAHALTLFDALGRNFRLRVRSRNARVDALLIQAGFLFLLVTFASAGAAAASVVVVGVGLILERFGHLADCQAGPHPCAG